VRRCAGACSMSEHKGLPDLVIFIITLALLSLGIVMVFSASSVTAYHELGDAYYYLKRQSLWAVIGLVALVICMNIDYHLWAKLAGPLIVASLIALTVVLVPGIGITISGSRRWLGVGIARVQPSEFAKLSMVIFLAAYLSASPDRVKSVVRGIFVGFDGDDRIGSSEPWVARCHVKKPAIKYKRKRKLRFSCVINAARSTRASRSSGLGVIQAGNSPS